MPEPSQDTTYDIAIIGGGIAGAGIARDAALRGLSVVVFEKDTFGSGTSGKSSKLIHGGIRYLETAWHKLRHGRFREAWTHFHFVFVSLKESLVLEKIAPGLVRPIPLLIPILKGRRGRFTVFTGSILYFLLALFADGARSPRFLWSKRSVLRILPELEERDLTGGVVIWDHWTEDKKLVEETMRAAKAQGAQTIEHAKVISYRRKEADLYELRVEVNGELRTYNARKLINASGPWIDKVRSAAGQKTGDYLLPIAGSHLVFKKFIPHSVILEAEDQRIFFVINTGEHSRVGTTERLYADPDTLETTEEEVDYLLRSLHHYFPKIRLGKNDILSKDSAIRPLVRPETPSSHSDISREHEIRKDAMGVYHVLGVKLTDHRRAAEEMVDLLIPDLVGSRPRIGQRTLTHRVPLEAR